MKTKEYLQITIERALGMMRTLNIIDQTGVKRINDVLREEMKKYGTCEE